MSTTPPITDQRDQPEQPQVSEEQRENTVLNLMFCDASDYPWSVEELARTIEDRTGVIDAVRRLEAAGLVHRIGEFVFPTLAARRADELGAGTI
jgi:hypothetical protein